MTKEMKHLIIFFFGALAWTWMFYFPIGIFQLDTSSGIGLALFLAGGPAPSFMGLIMVFATFTPAQRRDYFTRCIDVKRIGWWFLLPLLLSPLLALIVTGITRLIGGDLPGMETLHTLLSNPLLIPLALFLFLWSGPLNEEFGWRGYALDPLLARFGFIRGSVILGLIWGIWHLPWCFMAGQSQKLETFWLYVLSVVGLSLLMSLLHIKTRRSILAALLMHFCSNFFMSQLLSPTSALYETWRMVIWVIVGCLIAGYAFYRKDALLAGFRQELEKAGTGGGLTAGSVEAA
ncbi:MAG: CPBP family intramembrane metalloprotease [Leptolinea sp.]|nr:CPBP family intramembrane metalloprotease [Leptolinea sp.]